MHTTAYRIKVITRKMSCFRQQKRTELGDFPSYKPDVALCNVSDCGSRGICTLAH